MERRVRVPSWELGECAIPAGCRFDKHSADRAVKFFHEELSHTKGRWAGKPFTLPDFQLRDIREVFGRVNEHGNRVIRSYYKEIPKKNGKSEEAAGVALKLTFADDEAGAEVYGAAADRDQASIVFNVAASMVRNNPRLRKLSKVIDSTKRIIAPHWESFYRAISAEVAGKHGYNSHGVIFDEVHAQADMRLWEVLTFGAGAARTQPLIFAITTAGIPGESPVAEMLHEDADQILRGIIPCPDSFYPVLYSAPDDAPWDDEEVWRLCNPALGDFLNVDSVREEFERARRRPSEQNSFRRLRLNQWVKQETRWIDMDAWDACGRFQSVAQYQAWLTNEIRELKDFKWYAGLDLSTKRDLTAFVPVCLDGNGALHLIPYFWIPRDNLQDRPNMEAAKYRTWMDQGFLTATTGNEIDFKAVRSRVNEIGKVLKIAQIAYDPQFATQIAQELGEDGFQMVTVSQTFKHFTEPCIELEAAIGSGRMFHGGHPLLRWMADCVTVEQRSDGGLRPVKPSRLKSSKRIDGIVAALMGIGRAIVNNVNVQSAYADPARVVI